MEIPEVRDTYSYLELAMLAIPLLVAAIAQHHWPGRVKEVLCLLLCVAGGALVVVNDGGNLLDVAATAPVLYFATQGLYLKWLKPRGIAPWIERWTSLLTPFLAARSLTDTGRGAMPTGVTGLEAEPGPATTAAPKAPQKIVLTRESINPYLDPDLIRVLDELAPKDHPEGTRPATDKAGEKESGN